MDSTITITGNMVRDADLRFTASGAAVVGFGVAVNRRWFNKTTNDWEEQVSFIDCTAWGTLAENLSGSLSKGDRVIVTGRIEQESWEQEDGQKRTKLKIVADSVGPDLRWATCTMQKNERSGGQQQQGQQQQGQQQQAKPQPAAQGGYAGGGEPF